MLQFFHLIASHFHQETWDRKGPTTKEEELFIRDVICIQIYVVQLTKVFLVHSSCLTAISRRSIKLSEMFSDSLLMGNFLRGKQRRYISSSLKIAAHADLDNQPSRKIKHGAGERKKATFFKEERRSLPRVKSAQMVNQPSGDNVSMSLAAPCASRIFFFFFFSWSQCTRLENIDQSSTMRTHTTSPTRLERQERALYTLLLFR